MENLTLEPVVLNWVGQGGRDEILRKMRGSQEVEVRSGQLNGGQGRPPYRLKSFFRVKYLLKDLG